MTTHHLPISIPDILHGKTVEWERLILMVVFHLSSLVTTKPARPLAEAQIGGSLFYREGELLSK